MMLHSRIKLRYPHLKTGERRVANDRIPFKVREHRRSCTQSLQHLISLELSQYHLYIYSNPCYELVEDSALPLSFSHGWDCSCLSNSAGVRSALTGLSFSDLVVKKLKIKGNEALNKQYKQCVINLGSSSVFSTRTTKQSKDLQTRSDSG